VQKPQISMKGMGFSMCIRNRRLGFVSGHDFSRAVKGLKKNWALAPATAHPAEMLVEIILGRARCFYARTQRKSTGAKALMGGVAYGPTKVVP
jgi:hypothetical protein